MNKRLHYLSNNWHRNKKNQQTLSAWLLSYKNGMIQKSNALPKIESQGLMPYTAQLIQFNQTMYGIISAASLPRKICGDYLEAINLMDFSFIILIIAGEVTLINCPGPIMAFDVL